jgi:tetratricopeptide (TPR) repeat protein
MSSDHRPNPELLNQQAVDLLNRATRSRDPVLLGTCIALFEGIVAVTPHRHPHRATRLYNLAEAHRARYALTGQGDDADQAIGIGQQAVAAIHDGDTNTALILSNLSATHLLRFQRVGHPNDLDRVIQFGEQAVVATGADLNIAVYLSNLAAGYLLRFEGTGHIADLDRAIGIGERARSATPAHSPHRPTTLTNLGTAYWARFGRAGHPTDLDRAIDIGEQAVAADTGDTGDPNRVTVLSNLAVAYHDRFERTGSLADLERAIEHHEHAVAATPDDAPDGATCLSNLAVALRARFDRLGDVADLDRAVAYHEQAVAATPADHPDLAHRLSNLGLAYWSRFTRTGEVSDVDAAIDAGRRAVAATPDDHPDRAMRLNNLGNALQQRFEHSGSLHDLDRAVAHHEQVVAAVHPDHPSRAGYLSNLAVAYQARSQRSGAGTDFDRAVDLVLLALAATPDDHPDRVLRLFNLGRALQARYEHSGDPADLDCAVDLARETAVAIPADHPDRARYLFNLGYAHRLRFQRTGATSDLDRAVDAAERAVAATPDDHPRRAARIYLLGTCYTRRWNTGGALDRSRISRLAEHALAATTAPPFDRLRACWAAARLAYVLDERHTARLLLDSAVELLPLVAARETSSADHEHRLGANRGLVGETIAVHCALDDPGGAVRAGELGRAVLLASQLALRTPLADLEAEHPALARRLRRVRDALNAPDPPAMASPGGRDLDHVDRRKRLWAEYDAVLAEIRRLPGLDRFLLPPTWTKLRPTATGGAVVLLNAGLQRCDGIVVTADGPPLLVPLPELRLADVEARAAELTQATHDAGSFTGELRRQRVLTELLGWLWDTAVEPVLDAVERQLRPDDEVLPRVWWMPTGLLGLLPLHAAGHPGQAGALDRVISSYTPTLRALARARGRPAATALRRLTVALDRTPGLPDLPATAAEAASLHAAHPDMPLLTNEQATAARVTGALPEASWAHFACHAGTNPDAPSEGGLHLHDGVLPIAEIGRRNLHEAELAYLSACSTGHVGWRHADESIHLASAFQLAGFRHVVASLWPLDDRVAAGAADHFYRLMPDMPSADDAAVVLHRVIQHLRAEHTGRPHLWASLIHSGP